MDDGTSECWLPVVGYEGCYEVSDFGRVRSLPRRYTIGGILKSAASNKYGHQHVVLTVNNIRKTRYVHQLVAEAFLGPCPVGLEVRHWDGDPANNRLSNLLYGTHGENMQDMVRHGTHRSAGHPYCINNHEYTAENTYITPSGFRNCKECGRARSRAWKARDKGAA